MISGEKKYLGMLLISPDSLERHWKSLLYIVMEVHGVDGLIVQL